MLLKELYELYNRLSTRGADVARRGRSLQKIAFRIVIRMDGTLVGIRDARETEIRVKKTRKGNKETTVVMAKEQMVLGDSKPSGSGVNPCFLWDNPAYLLGHEESKPRALEYFEALKARHLAVEAEIGSSRYSAVCRFLEQWDPARCPEEFPDKACLTGNGVFRIQGDEEDVHDDLKVISWWDTVGCNLWRGEEKKGSAPEGECLITGKIAPVARLHEPAIKGVSGSQSTGAKLVSFNCDAFNSYGKDQSLNAPVSEAAAFAYCNALNYLLSNERNRVRLAGSTVVFWTDSPPGQEEEDEMLAGFALDPSRQPAMDEALSKRIQSRLEKIASGKDIGEEIEKADATRFFILGLSPNAARLSVRFFYESTLGDFIRNVAAHYKALRIQRRGGPYNDTDILSPYMILRETAREAEDIPPLFAGALMRSILLGSPYPDAIAMAILRRFRADHDVNRTRCAFLKAWLTRKNTSPKPSIMLDTDNTQPGYLLGRLFAILQKTQTDALGNINRTIQDAYYASASATPQSVFPRILRMYRHNLSKLPNEGAKVSREKLVQEVMGELTGFPAYLTPEQQGLFALGFYHQTQSFYTPRNPTTNN